MLSLQDFRESFEDSCLDGDPRAAGGAATDDPVVTGGKFEFSVKRGANNQHGRRRSAALHV
jgi:hypothetical protein